MKRTTVAIIAGVTLTMTVTTAYAETDHSMHNHSHEGHEMHGGQTMKMPEGMSMKTMIIDDYKVTVEIWDVPAYEKMMKDMKMKPMQPAPGAAHHIAVSIRKDNRKIENAAVKMKIISPGGKPQIVTLSYNPDMMHQYVGHFNMAQQGKYQVMTLFKIEGQKHKGGYWYEKK
ncbi:MAG: hypothetical protein IME96_07945 [Proteobacteria bacterium]|nr:hypothetical protein [Pseudomonadota bacterium]